MKYVVEHAELIEDPALRQKLRAAINRFAHQLDILPEPYRSEGLWRVHVSRTGSGNFRLSYSLKIEERLAFASEEGGGPVLLAEQLFQSFRRRLAEVLRAVREGQHTSRRTQRRGDLSHYLELLGNLRSAEDHPSFSILLKLLLPNLDRYLNRRLQAAVIRRQLSVNLYESPDLLDDLISQAYQDFEQLMAHATDINLWMLQQADRLVDQLVEEAAMKSELTGEPGDPAEPLFTGEQTGGIQYDLNRIIWAIGGMEELLSGNWASKEKKKLNERLHREISLLPAVEHAVFDLFVIEEMSVREIAFVKGLSPPDVEDHLANAFGRIEEQIRRWADSLQENEW